MNTLRILITLLVLVSMTSGCGQKKKEPEHSLKNDVIVRPILEAEHQSNVEQSTAEEGSSRKAEFVERRAAFDIGSGSMKLRVMDVIFREDGNEYSEVHDGSHHRRVDFQASIDESGEISQEALDNGLKSVVELKRIAVEMGAEQFAGVATGAFRKAINGEQVLAQLSAAADIPFMIVSSEEEAMLAFQAAEQFSAYEPENLVVWDIGASTMSLSGMSLEGNLDVYESSLASTGLRDDVIRSIQGKLSDENTPNPLLGNEADVAVVLVQSEAEKTVPRSLVERISMKSTVVAGVGPVHNLSVRRLLGEGVPYTVEEVEKALYRHLNKTDAQIGGNFADTDVVNLVLVLGFMRGLKVSEIQAVEVNMAHGLIQNENYWR